MTRGEGDGGVVSRDGSPGAARSFPMTTFVDEGLLHYFNARIFWPLGMTLTASRIRPGDRLRPVVEHAAEGLGLTDAQVTVLAERIAEASGIPAAGLELVQHDPAEVIVSGLSDEDQASRRERAKAWIERRKREVRP